MKKREPNSPAQPAKLVRRKYDEEFKQQALAMVRNGQSVRSVAEALGISENLIHQWRRAARANQSSAELEVEHLRQRLKQVEVDTEFRSLLDQHGYEQSMSRADETYNNAHAESLFLLYKAELLEGGAFADVEEARMETFIYIESYYNWAPRRSALGYQSPEDFERTYYRRTGASENFGQRPGKDMIAKQHSCPLK